MPNEFQNPDSDLRLRPGQDLVLVDADNREILRIDASQGIIRVRRADATTARLDGQAGNLFLGGSGTDGDLLLFSSDAENGSTEATVRLDGNSATLVVGRGAHAGSVKVDGPNQGIELDGTKGNVSLTGTLRLVPRNEGRPRIRLTDDGEAHIGNGATHGRLLMTNANGTTTHRLEGESGQAWHGGPGHPGLLILRNGDDETAITANAERHEITVGSATDGGTLLVRSGNADHPEAIRLLGSRGEAIVGTRERHGFISVRTARDEAAIQLNGERADLLVGAPETELGPGQRGYIALRDATSQTSPTVQLRGDEADILVGRQDNAGSIIVRDAQNRPAIHLSGDEGNINVRGDIRLLNADCAEEFPIACTVDPDGLPGTVVRANDDGDLVPTDEAHDRRVLGVVSGAGSLAPGLTLDTGASDRPRAPVGLVGKVYCKVDATSRPVRIGDVLVPASRPGYAMAAKSREDAIGCTIGKALQPLADGLGLVKIFATLG